MESCAGGQNGLSSTGSEDKGEFIAKGEGESRGRIVTKRKHQG